MHIDTQLVRATPDELTGASVAPIYQTSSFAYGTAEELEGVFAGRRPGYVYSRIGNPTVDHFEQRMARLEGGLGAVACASGMAAITTAVLGLAGAGDDIVSGSSIFGGTHSLFARTLPRFGIRTKFVDSRDPDAFDNAIGGRTKCLFVEAVGNPKLDVPDLSAICKVAHRNGVAVVVDSTTCTPVLVRPGELGADLIVHSTSKYINGHGSAIGGVIVDRGSFDWSGPRYPQLHEHHRRVGEFAYLASLRSQVHRDIGACFSPFDAFLMCGGLDTLAVRMDRHCANAAAVAQYLRDHPAVDEVRYPGLAGHPDHATAARQFRRGFGALLTCRLGSKQACFDFINGLRHILNVANLGDARTLVIHPASTFCRDADERQRSSMGVTDDLVRLSVGLEHADDIIEDIDQSLSKRTL